MRSIRHRLFFAWILTFVLAATAAAAPSPSTHSGMGAVVYQGGTAFRVWAPNADRVFVAGDFNAWSDSATELASEGNGNFSADVAGARAGQTYEYVIMHAGETLRRADPRARRMTSSAGKSVIVGADGFQWTAAGYRTPSFDEQVVYEMHVGTFNDDPGGAPGTFRTATAKLDHLARLGVNMVELLPIAEFAGDFSWGYNTAFPFAPESAYGSPADVKTFVDAAHARGIGVVLDVVHNHYGPSDLSMWRFDGASFSVNGGGIFFYNDWRADSGWGPRPDYGRPQVRDFIVDSALFWLDEYRVDGLRWDATASIHAAGGTPIPEGWDLLRRANDTVDAQQPWKIMIAEDMKGNAAVTRPTSAGGAGFDTQWDASFVHAIRSAIEPASDAGRSMSSVRDAIAGAFDGRATSRVVYTESHDEVANGKTRVPEAIWPGNAASYYSKKRSTLGAAIALTAPGIPMLFQGQELLEDGWFSDTDPLDWSKAVRNDGIVRLYTDLIRLRRNLDGTTRGLRGNNVNVYHVNDGAKVIAFHRWDRGGAGDDVIVVANFSGQAFPNYDLGFPRGGTWKVRFNGDWAGYSSDFNDTRSVDVTTVPVGAHGFLQRGTVGIGPYSVVILSQ